MFAKASFAAIFVFLESVWAAAYHKGTSLKAIIAPYAIGRRSAVAYATAKNYLQKHQPHITLRNVYAFI